MSAIDDVTAERQRQVSVEGFTFDHDDVYTDDELIAAAVSYLMAVACRDYDQEYKLSAPPETWPWDLSWWKPKDRRRDLVRAAALIIAEIERMDRDSA